MIDSMPRRRRLFERKEINRHGKTVWYFRRPGEQRVRLPNEYNSAEYIAAYEAALAGKPTKPVAASSASLAWLVDRYKESAKFASLAPSTRRLRDNILKKLCESSGTQPYASIKRKHIQAAMDRKAATPNAANNTLIVVSQMFQWAVKAEKIEKNPCDGVDMIKVETDGFHTWSVDEVEQYRHRHAVGTKPRLALDLMLFCGLRRSDLFKAGKQHVKDDVLTMRTQKTGTTVYLTICQELRESIAATATGDLAFLTSATGRPFASAQSFANWFKAQVKAADLPAHCTAHGLRKAGATIAANNGASAHELMAMYGWSRLAMAELYTKEADKLRLARGASERIANSRKPHLDIGCGQNDEKKSEIN